MKILFISMPSIHVIRWLENIKDSSLELYWFDILNIGTLETSAPLKQFTNWRIRKVRVLKGEYFLSKKMPQVYSSVRPLLELTENKFLEEIIKQIQPDVVHSFEMQHCSYPIITTMNKYPEIKWIYSCWGSDLFHYQNIKTHHSKIKKVLKRVDFLFTDCIRDYEIAKALGFNGEFAGVFAGGGGYDLLKYQHYILPLLDRKIILVKGYEHGFGRAINVIKALANIGELKHEVVIFGAHQKVIEYVKTNNLPYKTYWRNELAQDDLMKLMGSSVLSIGNSISDGMPNTLLESIILQSFPIQSNPGNATAEIIEDGVNGYLIQNPDDINEIEEKITLALNNLLLREQAMAFNKKLAIERLSYQKIQEKINAFYIDLNK